MPKYERMRTRGRKNEKKNKREADGEEESKGEPLSLQDDMPKPKLRVGE